MTKSRKPPRRMAKPKKTRVASVLQGALKYAPLIGWILFCGSAASGAAVLALDHFGGSDRPYAGRVKLELLAQNVQQMQQTNAAQMNALKLSNQASSLQLLPLWQGQRTTACAALRHNPADPIALQHYTEADGHVKSLEGQLGLIPSNGCPR